ncbi:arginine--tRNA ligase [Galbibacter sp. EGI 63066]|uniref:arginine--tRNA ligase n=1 Tax=Galbibacter sp. EGI 63066 TaxID=2993559 RepID=UPI002248D2A2|nr:arginine--tRNA ligase [Galbibacter sp. EGI 63066]MCX2680501.1 arginine--tRNA ligase [Galbibacter sp. EGI 63066]
MSIHNTITTQVQEAVRSIFEKELETVELQATRKEFEGDITVVVFPMLRTVKGNPQHIGEEIGAYLTANVAEIEKFNVVKGFLNLVIADGFFLDFFNNIKKESKYGFTTPEADGKAVMVEYSSPNTNKPLHLGHIRNNLLGYSVAEILKASGKKVYKTQIINDRGIHICKSMLAWQKFGNGETPESTGLKGDKLVGNYYVKFDQELKKEAKLYFDKFRKNELPQNLISQNKKAILNLNSEIESNLKSGTAESLKKAKELEKTMFTVAAGFTSLSSQAFQMLRKWEAGDEEVVTLWKKMNGWVYKGFSETYENLGVDFDKLYYESDTYLLGKDVVADGLERGIFYKKEDGSVWIDLTDEGLDEKIVLRADGTAVYMTQDIGTAIQRVKDHPDVGGMVYTVGNEQDYHFKVLFLILKKLGFSWAENLYHLSYGMVDLPSGKMKSREGTVVDADDLIVEMTETAGEIASELGKLDGFTTVEKQELYKTIGLGALKYYILKVDPKKRILFDPKESIDFQGNTGPFIQYTYARIQSILRKSDFDYNQEMTGYPLHEKEKELIKQLQLFPEVVQLAAESYSPALVANYVYDLVKAFNSFYQNVSILGTEDDKERIFRVQLSKKVGEVIADALSLLGIQVPERM